MVGRDGCLETVADTAHTTPETAATYLMAAEEALEGVDCVLERNASHFRFWVTLNQCHDLDHHGLQFRCLAFLVRFRCPWWAGVDCCSHIWPKIQKTWPAKTPHAVTPRRALWSF
jgi:hypothetical protein